MTEFKIEAKLREGKPNKARREGFVPAIIYGSNFENKKIALDKINFLRIFKEAGTSNLIDVAIDGEKELSTLVHEIQYDPIKNDILHVDFFKVNMKEKIHAEIPLEFIGDSPAVLNLEGSLITSKDSIEVECLPGDLVSEIQIDVSGLDDFEKNIKVTDIKVPTGLEIIDDPDEVVAYVQEPRSEEELEALETEVVEDVEAVEVEEKGADEESAEESDNKDGQENKDGKEDKKIEKSE